MNRLLSHAPRRGLRPVPFLGDLTLAPARVHEFCGQARRTLAVMLAARVLAQGASGPVFWISPSWMPETLHTDGLSPFLPPGRIIHVTPQRAEDLLWSMEECLRAGAVALVIADIPGLPGLTPVRRLHLAAETGAEEGDVAPLGVLLTPGAGGAQGVESRWELQPDHTPERTRWQLHRRRARTAPQKSWQVSGKPGAWRLGRPDASQEAATVPT